MAVTLWQAWSGPAHLCSPTFQHPCAEVQEAHYRPSVSCLHSGSLPARGLCSLCLIHSLHLRSILTWKTSCLSQNHYHTLPWDHMPRAHSAYYSLDVLPSRLLDCLPKGAVSSLRLCVCLVHFCFPLRKSRINQTLKEVYWLVEKIKSTYSASILGKTFIIPW